MNNCIEETVALKNITPKGILADRIKLSLERHLQKEGPLCKYINWGADQVARWIGATAVLTELAGVDTIETVKARISELIDAQDDSGLFYGEKRVVSDDPEEDLGNARRNGCGR